jgi:hypothetical protein
MDIEYLEAISSEIDMFYLEPRDVFDAAIVGLAERADGMCVLAYSRTRCIEALSKQNDWSYDSAVEWFEFNTAGAYAGEGTPVFIEFLDTLVFPTP